MTESSDPNFEAIDTALSEWRQGDFALEERWFVHAADLSQPLTPAAGEERETGAAGLQAVMSEVDGLVVVSQTCDVVRKSAERPFIEVCPVVSVPEEKLADIEKGRRPAHATFHALSKHGLAVDLDRVMTVEKGVVASWTRTPGCRDATESTAFARALARKRVRFAFPDDFTIAAGKLQERMKKKHDKDSPEGRALRALREIRVSASPSWDAAKVQVDFWFIREPEQRHFEGESWDTHLENWLALLESTGRFEFEGTVVALEDMTAAEYVASAPLDLDHLSSAR